jgi:hypothetical protein
MRTETVTLDFEKSTSCFLMLAGTPEKTDKTTLYCVVTERWSLWRRLTNNGFAFSFRTNPRSPAHRPQKGPRSRNPGSTGPENGFAFSNRNKKVGQPVHRYPNGIFIRLYALAGGIGFAFSNSPPRYNHPIKHV